MEHYITTIFSHENNTVKFRQESLEIFIKENKNFLRYGPTQKSIKMLQSFINAKLITAYTSQFNFKLILLQILQNSCLNELEIALWTMLIEKDLVNKELGNIHKSLIFTAILSKEFFGENIEYVLQKYSEKQRNLITLYNYWKSQKNFTEISLTEVNIRYNELTINIYEDVNYNYYLDEVLLKYLPYLSYQSIKKRNKKVVNSQFQRKKLRRNNMDSSNFSYDDFLSLDD